MRRSRFTDDDIAALLVQAERGRAVAEVCAEAGVTERTFYRWRAKFGAPPLRAIHALQRLEQENRALKRAVLRAGAPGPTGLWPFDDGAVPAARATRAPSAYRNCRVR